MGVNLICYSLNIFVRIWFNWWIVFSYSRKQILKGISGNIIRNRVNQEIQFNFRLQRSTTDIHWPREVLTRLTKNSSISVSEHITVSLLLPKLPTSPPPPPEKSLPNCAQINHIKSVKTYPGHCILLGGGGLKKAATWAQYTIINHGLFRKVQPDQIPDNWQLHMANNI